MEIAPAEATEEIVDALARLVPQLSPTAPTPLRDDVAAIVGSPATTLLAARDEDRIIGVLTLVVFPTPTGVKARIEDVVVDEAARGRGVGEALTREAIELARAAGARYVELTSHASREAANRLYRRLGFEPRGTNVYRFDL